MSWDYKAWLRYISLQLHRFADWLDNLHITRIFAAMTSFLLVLTLIAYIQDLSVKEEEKQERNEQRVVNAWQLIAIGAPGDTGKFALELLKKAGSSLRGINLAQKTLETSFKREAGFGVFLQKLNLPNTNLAFSNFAGADLSQADLQGSFLYRTNFSYSRLANSNLRKADLRLSDLRNADLAFTDFSGADLTGADLTAVDLSGASLFETNLSEVSLQDANMNNTLFFNAKLISTNLSNANLENAILISNDFTVDENTLTDESTCDQLRKAKNWELADRGPELACGAPIPGLTADEDNLQ